MHQAETATEALERVRELEKGGYHVRPSTAEGEDLSIATLAARIVLDEV